MLKTSKDLVGGKGAVDAGVFADGEQPGFMPLRAW